MDRESNMSVWVFVMVGCFMSFEARCLWNGLPPSKKLKGHKLDAI